MVEGAQKSGGALSGDGAGNHGSARGAFATRYRFGFGSRVGRTTAKHRPRCCCVSTDASDIRMVYLGALRRHCTVPLSLTQPISIGRFALRLLRRLAMAEPGVELADQLF